MLKLITEVVTLLGPPRNSWGITRSLRPKGSDKGGGTTFSLSIPRGSESVTTTVIHAPNTPLVTRWRDSYLKKKKLPLRYIELNDVKEMELGALVMFLFIETIFCCYLIDVNPFDQPAVEEGKILTKKILENE